MSFTSATIGSGLGAFALYEISEVNEVDRDRLLRSIKSGADADLMRFLKDGRVDPNIRHKLGWAALHVAAINGQKHAVERLLSAGADPNIPEEFTNIYDTARAKGLHSMDVMVARETEFSDKLNLRANFRGCTPLHYAVLADDAACISLLLEAGADPSASNVYGRTPLDYARGDRVLQLLQKYAGALEERRLKEEQALRKKYPLEKRLKEVIVGQDGAIATVASAIRRKENGWIDDEHPLVFLFLGSSGIGKTELAKQVCYHCYLQY